MLLINTVSASQNYSALNQTLTFGSSTEHFKERKFVFCILYHTFAVILTVTWGSYGLFLLTSLGSLVTGSAREVLAVLLALTCPAYGLFHLTGFGSLIAGSAREVLAVLLTVARLLLTCLGSLVAGSAGF